MTTAFCDAIRTRDAGRLAAWLTEVTTTDAEDAVRAFAAGIQRDRTEVFAAVESGFSNGRTEGHVNRLKLIKREMYGRAKFGLLRIRVLASGP